MENVDTQVLLHTRAEIAGLEREKQLAQRDVETEKKKAEELARERDILTKLNSQAENASHKHLEMIRLNENNRRTLEQEIAGYKHESRKQQKVHAVSLHELQCPWSPPPPPPPPLLSPDLHTPSICQMSTNCLMPVGTDCWSGYLSSPFSHHLALP